MRIDRNGMKQKWVRENWWSWLCELRRMDRSLGMKMSWKRRRKESMRLDLMEGRQRSKWLGMQADSWLSTGCIRDCLPFSRSLPLTSKAFRQKSGWDWAFRMNGMPRVEQKKHFNCSKKAKTIKEHAKCVVGLLKIRDEEQRRQAVMRSTGWSTFFFSFFFGYFCWNNSLRKHYFGKPPNTLLFYSTREAWKPMV